MKTLLTLMSLIFCLSAFSQGGPGDKAGGGGNGGDYIRMKFMTVGNFILQNYKDGLKEIESVASVEALRSTLDIKVIKLSGLPLIDNGGSKVDAIGSQGRITLFEGMESMGTGWYGIFNKADLVEKLVLHEMLRAAGVNDDNYVYSDIVLNKYDTAQFDKTAYIRWCSESASFIESALKQGLLSKTYDQEILLYEKALGQVEDLISPKHFYFVEPSVKGTAKILPLFKTNKNRVNFMRLALRQIANDIRYVDSQLKKTNAVSRKTLGDNSQYAKGYLGSAAKFTILAETAEIEAGVLNIVFGQTYAYMINSDYARVRYSSVFSELDSAINTPVTAYKRQSIKNLSFLLR